MNNICKCGPPFYYAPVVYHGRCRICLGYSPILSLKQIHLREIGIKF